MLQLSHISYTYTMGTPSIDDVTLVVNPGEIVALMGPNGSGKSTVMRIAAGQKIPSNGSISIDDLTINFDAIHDVDDIRMNKYRSLIGYMSQDPDDQLVMSTVLEEVMFGCLNIGMDNTTAKACALEALKQCGLDQIAECVTSRLSGGQRQLVVLAACMAMQPRYLLLDEPCSMLDAQSKKRLIDIVRRASDQGLGILYITHDVEEIKTFNHVIVLKRGSVASSGTLNAFLRNLDLQKDACCLSPIYLQNNKYQWLDYTDQRANNREHSDGLAAVDASFSFDFSDSKPKRKRFYSKRKTENRTVTSSPKIETPIIDRLNLRLYRGSCMLVTGPIGCGKSTLLRLLAGLIEPDTGVVCADGIRPSPKTVGLSFQRAQDQLFASTVYDDVAFGPKNIGVDQDQIDSIVHESIVRVGLDPNVYGGRSPFSLSGGEARRVALAGVLALRTRYLLLDEPTVGLDANGYATLKMIIQDLLSDGIGIVIVTHDPLRFVDIATCAFVLNHGTITWMHNAQELKEALQ